MDKTSKKIIDAMMDIILEKGYAGATTKDVAERAGVNECTIFRKFKEKKEIVLAGMNLEQYRPKISSQTFSDIKWDIEEDLKMFMENYMKEVTPRFVRLSIGLRSPQIYEQTAPLIMDIPNIFLRALTDYLTQMKKMKKIRDIDCGVTAAAILSATFGYTFFSASFEDDLITANRSEYINTTVKSFVGGIVL
ncbi:MAG: TetR/AcrR family transcriptional regulator [Clostridia bacterium]|nr:TetR/AcrR family transcriptional regulator [Clostridia bacterium]MDE7079436.1 TetR/AcrR family transcriptional regulator [Clostridia bacterium]